MLGFLAENTCSCYPLSPISCCVPLTVWFCFVLFRGKEMAVTEVRCVWNHSQPNFLFLSPPLGAQNTQTEKYGIFTTPWCDTEVRARSLRNKKDAKNSFIMFPIILFKAESWAVLIINLLCNWPCVFSPLSCPSITPMKKILILNNQIYYSFQLSTCLKQQVFNTNSAVMWGWHRLWGHHIVDKETFTLWTFIWFQRNRDKLETPKMGDLTEFLNQQSVIN